MADGLGQHIPKGYIYFAMAFSAFVEILNLKAKRSRAAPAQLHAPYPADEERGPPAPSAPSA